LTLGMRKTQCRPLWRLDEECSNETAELVVW
jgi:hypothetical protein